jgi:predicted MFS family arabinose efflux permease
MLIFPRLGAWLAGKMSAASFFATGLLIIGVADVALGLSASLHLPLTFVVIVLLTGGVGCALINAQISSAAVTVAPIERAGMASAISVIMRQIGFALGIALVGFLAAQGSFPLAFAGAGAVSLLGAALCWWLLQSGAKPDPAG